MRCIKMSQEYLKIRRLHFKYKLLSRKNTTLERHSLWLRSVCAQRWRLRIRNGGNTDKLMQTEEHGPVRKNEMQGLRRTNN